MLSITVCIAKLSALATQRLETAEEEDFVREMSDDHDQFSGGSILFPYSISIYKLENVTSNNMRKLRENNF